MLTLMTILAFLVLLGVLITVHELGHFIVAKLVGVRVLTFSIGFGPKLVSFRRGETEYRVALLPFGGYVRMYGDDVNEPVPAAERHRAFLEKPIPHKMAIAVAGPVANLLLPLVLFFAVSVGSETVPAATVGTLLPGEPAAAAGLLPGDTITAVDGEAIADFGDLIAAIGARPNTDTTLSVQRPGQGVLTLHVTPKATPSPSPMQKAPIGRIGMLVTRAQPVVTVAAGSPAAKAGVIHGDRVVEVDGQAITDAQALARALDEQNAAAPLHLVVERAPVPPATEPSRHAVVVPGDDSCVAGDVDAACDGAVEGGEAIAELRFAVLDADLKSEALQREIAGTRAAVVAAVQTQRRFRGLASVDGVVAAVEPDSPAADRGLQAKTHRVVAVDGAPLRMVSDLQAALQARVDDVHTIGLVDGDGHGAVFSFLMKPSSRRELGGQKILGVALTSSQGGAATITRSVSVAEAARRAIVTTGETIVDVAAGYVMLFTGNVGLDQLGGPVMMASIAGEAARSGIEVFVGTMALLSVNLALLNLLPVPVLDGGHLLLFSIEAIRRKRLSPEARLRATKIGVLFVGALMLVAIFNDVASFFR